MHICQCPVLYAGVRERRSQLTGIICTRHFTMPSATHLLAAWSPPSHVLAQRSSRCVLSDSTWLYCS